MVKLATITTARAAIEARVLVTERIRPIRVRKRLVHQIGLPYHWGSKGLVRGDSANELISFVADPNVSIQESKALTGNIRPDTCELALFLNVSAAVMRK